jgi:hypothetical protein
MREARFAKVHLVVNDPGQNMFSCQIYHSGTGRRCSRPDSFNAVTNYQNVLFGDSAFVDQRAVG